jgi:hypothetical protein
LWFKVVLFTAFWACSFLRNNSHLNLPPSIKQSRKKIGCARGGSHMAQ